LQVEKGISAPVLPCDGPAHHVLEYTHLVVDGRRACASLLATGDVRLCISLRDCPQGARKGGLQMLFNDAEPTLTASRLQGGGNPALPFLCEVRERDRRLIDNAEMLTAGNIAENPVKHFSRYPLTRADLLPMAHSTRVLEVNPPVARLFKHSAHPGVLR